MEQKCEMPNTWTLLPDIHTDRPKVDMDELRRDYFRNRFPRLGEWIMEEGDEDEKDL